MGSGCGCARDWPREVLVDLIFEPVGIRITDEVLERGEDLNVAGMQADYGGVLQIARAFFVLADGLELSQAAGARSSSRSASSTSSANCEPSSARSGVAFTRSTTPSASSSSSETLGR